MKKNSRFPVIRVDSELEEQMNKAILKINNYLGFEITLSDFRRLAYKDFARAVINSDLSDKEPTKFINKPLLIKT